MSIANSTPHALYGREWAGEDADGRVMMGWTVNSRDTVIGLLEYPNKLPTKEVHDRIKKVSERLPRYPVRAGAESGDALTFELCNFAKHGDRMALVYNCPKRPPTLHDVLKSRAKPPRHERAWLALTIARAVRSLSVAFDVEHPCLRAQSFVFVRASDDGEPDLNLPILLDWARHPTPSLYQHPMFGMPAPDNPPTWACMAFSMTMVLGEIVDWKPLDAPPFGISTQELQRLKDERIETLRKQSFFSFAFGELLQGPQLHNWTKAGQVERFYDNLCERLEKAHQEVLELGGKIKAGRPAT